MSSSFLDPQKVLSHTITNLLFARETAVFMTFIPTSVLELVNLRGTSRLMLALSCTLRMTVSHSLPWDLWTVNMRVSLYCGIFSFSTLICLL